MATDMEMGVPDLMELRMRLADDALRRSFRDGKLGSNVSDRGQRIELMFTALLAWEFADPGSPLVGDKRLEAIVLPSLERIGGDLAKSRDLGLFFGLSEYTRALRFLENVVEPGWFSARVAEGEAHYRNGNREPGSLASHDYLNPRAMEAESCFGLHHLTGAPEYLDRCLACLDGLVQRQYPCGALPYHTGGWIWGRRPSLTYQYLCATLMLHVGRELKRPEVVESVRRMVQFALLSTTRRGESFVALFEGLHKTATLRTAGRLWAVAAGLEDSAFTGLARRAYEAYVGELPDNPFDRLDTGTHEALVEALDLGIQAAPAPVMFEPLAGIHLLPDISSVFVHEDRLDLGMTLLTGYSALAEADAGSIRLYALTPELTDGPTFSNAGLDALRLDWTKPSEQIACRLESGEAQLKGRNFTKWTQAEVRDRDPERHLHTRELLITMTYKGGTLLLDYETLVNKHPGPLPARLLFLLFAYPRDKAAHLVLPDTGDVEVPAAESNDAFRRESSVGPVIFRACDGSSLEIVPERSSALKIVAARVPGVRPDPGSDRPAAPPLEGCLRLAFEGPDVLERGVYQIRFSSFQFSGLERDS